MDVRPVRVTWLEPDARELALQKRYRRVFAAGAGRPTFEAVGGEGADVAQDLRGSDAGLRTRDIGGAAWLGGEQGGR